MLLGRVPADDLGDDRKAETSGNFGGPAGVTNMVIRGLAEGGISEHFAARESPTPKEEEE